MHKKDKDWLELNIAGTFNALAKLVVRVHPLPWSKLPYKVVVLLVVLLMPVVAGVM